MLERFDLLRYQHSNLKTLSMGMRKRVGIISAIMNYPKLIILD
ncbi:MAG: ATP-binding cassette domain-containing protein, partial [Clostridiales Family XIII bacterium]|nr:ATP-binding cassette domain-containing protein [Clostridiales Family XIII bacterium]